MDKDIKTMLKCLIYVLVLALKGLAEITLFASLIGCLFYLVNTYLDISVIIVLLICIVWVLSEIQKEITSELKEEIKNIEVE